MGTTGVSPAVAGIRNGRDARCPSGLRIGRNNAETGEIVGFEPGNLFGGQLGDVAVAENGIPAINDAQLRPFPQLLEVMERRKSKVKVRQKGGSLLFNPYEPLLCLRQSRLQLAHARDARVLYNSIRRHPTLIDLNSKI